MYSNYNPDEWFRIYFVPVGMKDCPHSRKPYIARNKEELARDVLDMQDSCARIVVEHYMTRKAVYDWRMDAELLKEKEAEFAEYRRQRAALKTQIAELEKQISQLDEFLKP